jgi:hypothetical protein
MLTTPDALSANYIRTLFVGHPQAISLLDEVTGFYGEALTIRRAQVGNDPSGYEIAVDAPNLRYGHAYLNLNTSTNRVPAAACHELLHLRLAARGFAKVRTLELQPEQAVDTGFFNAAVNTVINAVDHNIFKDDFVSMGFPIESFLAKTGSATDYENEAKNSPPNGTPPQLLFFDWVWWSREYISNYFGIDQGVENAESLTDSVEKWGTVVLPGFRQTVVLIRQWARNGLYQQAAKYPESIRQLFEIMHMPPISSFYFLKRDQTGQIIVELIT